MKAHSLIAIIPTAICRVLVLFLFTSRGPDKHSLLLHTTAKYIDPKNVKNTEPPTQTHTKKNKAIFTPHPKVFKNTNKLSCEQIFKYKQIWIAPQPLAIVAISIPNGLTEAA